MLNLCFNINSSLVKYKWIAQTRIPSQNTRHLMMTCTSVETSLLPPQTTLSLRSEQEEEAWWSEYSEEEKDLEDKMLERYGDPEEEVADDRIKEMWEESDEEESDEKGHGSEESSEEEDEDEE